MKKKELKTLVLRFAADDWQWLCAQGDFLTALDRGVAEQVAAVAQRLLQDRDAPKPGDNPFAERVKAESDAKHKEIADKQRAKSAVVS